jgi:zinc transport system substrate-binding protein
MRRYTTTWIGLATFSLGMLFAFIGCGRAPDPWADVPGGPVHVVASFTPLYCFAKSVAGPDAKVLCLLTTTGPHEFRPTELDALKLKKADLFLVNGLGLDDWVSGMVSSAHNANLKVIPVGKAIPADKLLALDAEDEDRGKSGHDHDPHVWLSPPLAERMVERIRDALKEKDPAHAADYAKRAAEYKKELDKLWDYGKTKFQDKKNRKVVAMHDSLRYFAGAFNLEIVGSIEPQPGIEADAKKLADLTELCRKENVRIIAIEPQFPQFAAETLARQLKQRNIDVHLVEVDPMETVDSTPAPSYYVRTMRANVDRLAQHIE